MLLLATAIWGWSFVVVKEAVAGYGVAGFLGLRFAIASVVLGMLAVGHFNKRTLLIGAGIGVALAAGYYCQTLGLRYATVTNSGFITSLFVVTTPIINRLLFGVKIRPMLWAAVGVSLVGLYLLTGSVPPQDGSASVSPAAASGDEDATASPADSTVAARHEAGETPALRGEMPVFWSQRSLETIGNLLTLAAAVLYGLHIALLDRYSKGHYPLTLVLGQTMTVAVVCLAIWPLSEPVEWPSGEVWGALLITGILATAVTFVIQTYVQQRLSAIASTLILSLEPVFATVSGCLLLAERLGGVQMVGIALMMAAIVVAQLGAGEHASTYPLDPL
jgi:drug/metabolite transporter (DMT)-like permease